MTTRTEHLLLLGLLSTAAAQTEAPPTGSVSGVARDAGTNQPASGALIFVGHGRSGEIQTLTALDGAYRLTGIPPGLQTISARGPTDRVAKVQRRVTVVAGQDAPGIDFLLPGYGSIAGRVLDENKEPVSGVHVYAGAQVFASGELRSSLLRSAVTNDAGEYLLQDIPAGRPVFLLARHVTPHLDVMSKSPAEIELRKRVHVPVYFPSGPTPGAAQMLTLHSGERAEGMDLLMHSSPSNCASGAVRAATHLALEELPLTVVDPDDGGTGGSISGGATGPSGAFRICGLHPGDYRLSAVAPGPNPSDPPLAFGTATLHISDRDLRDVAVMAKARVPISGEVVFSGDAPDPPLPGKMHFMLMPLGRPSWGGEFKGLSADSPIPGAFSFPGVFADDYQLWIAGAPPGAYIKEATYAGEGVLYAPLHAGQGTGLSKTLRVTLATDGGTLQARTVDKDGNAVANCYVFVIPKETASDEALASALITGQTDQRATYSSAALPPGKYLVTSSTERVYKRPESLTRLWRALRQAQVVDLPAKSTVQVTLEPVELN